MSERWKEQLLDLFEALKVLAFMAAVVGGMLWTFTT